MLVLVMPPAQITAQSNWIVSGDTHLLSLKNYQGMRIIDAAKAVNALAQ